MTEAILDSTVKSWLETDRFKSLPYEKKSAVVGEYFNQSYSGLDDLKGVPESRINSVRDTFVIKHIGEKPDPSWGETIRRSLVTGASEVNQSLFRLGKDVSRGLMRTGGPTGLLLPFAEESTGKKYTPEQSPWVEKAFDAGIEWAERTAERHDISGELAEQPMWKPKRLVGTGLRAIPQISAVIAGAASGGPVGAATMLGAIAYGSAAEEAKAEGANEVQQALHGITSAEIEIITEAPVFKAVGKLWKHLKKSGISDSAANNFSARLLKGLGMYPSIAGKEAAQEAAAYTGGQLSKKAIYDKDAPITLKDATEAAYGGFAMSAVTAGLGTPAAIARARVEPTKPPPTKEEIDKTPSIDPRLETMKADLQAGKITIDDVKSFQEDPAIQEMGLVDGINDIIIGATSAKPLAPSKEGIIEKLEKMRKGLVTTRLAEQEKADIAEREERAEASRRLAPALMIEGEPEDIGERGIVTLKESETDRLVREVAAGRYGFTKPERRPEPLTETIQRELEETRQRIAEEKQALKQQLDREKAGRVGLQSELLRQQLKRDRFPAVKPTKEKKYLSLPRGQGFTLVPDDNYKDIISHMRDVVAAGEPGRRTVLPTGEPQVFKSSYPRWMSNKGWGKVEVLRAIDKYINDKPLGGKEKRIIDAAKEEAHDNKVFQLSQIIKELNQEPAQIETWAEAAWNNLLKELHREGITTETIEKIRRDRQAQIQSEVKEEVIGETGATEKEVDMALEELGGFFDSMAEKEIKLDKEDIKKARGAERERAGRLETQSEPMKQQREQEKLIEKDLDEHIAELRATKEWYHKEYEALKTLELDGEKDEYVYAVRKRIVDIGHILQSRPDLARKIPQDIINKIDSDTRTTWKALGVGTKRLEEEQAPYGIPSFGSTPEALAFGKKATPEQITALKEKSAETEKEFLALQAKADGVPYDSPGWTKAMQAMSDKGNELQFYNEAIRASEGAEYLADVHPTLEEKETTYEKEAYKSKEEADEAVKSVAEQVEEYNAGVSNRTVSDSIREYKSGIAKELLGTRRIEVVGRHLTKGKEAQELVEIFQGYRSPKMENMIVVYRDDHGNILNHTVFSSGQIQYITFDDMGKFAHKINSAADRLGATKVDIIHNHPSGDPSMSEHDIVFAKWMHNKISKNRIGEFITINHTRFNRLEWTSKQPTIHVGDYRVDPSHGNWIFKKEKNILNPEALASFGKNIKFGKGKFVAIFLDSKNFIQGWSVHNDTFLKNKSYSDIRKTFGQHLRAHDAVNVALITDLPEASLEKFYAHKSGDWLLDVLLTKGVSLREKRKAAFGSPSQEMVISKRLHEDSAPYEISDKIKEYLNAIPGYKEAVEKLEKGESFKGIKEEGAELLTSFQKRFGKGYVSDADIGIFRKTFGLPYWLGKKFKSVGSVVDFETRMQEERQKELSDDYDGDLGRIQKEAGKDKKISTELIGLIFEWDRRGRFPEKEVPADWYERPVAGEDIQINQEHYKQVENYLKKRGASDRAVEAFVVIRKKLDEKLVDIDRTMRVSKLEPTLVEEFRAQMGRVHNYFPHRRTGNSYVAAVHKEKKHTVYNEHYNAFKDQVLPTGKKARARAKAWLKNEIGENAGEYKIIQGKVTQLPDEVFMQIPVEAVQQVLAKAGRDLEKSRVEYEAERLYDKGVTDSKEEALALARKRLHADMEAALSKAVATVFKSRGFGSHMIFRKGIPGHETDDVFGILFDYLSGYAGFKTKIKRAKHHHGVLVNMNAAKTPKEYVYTSTLVKDLLQNQDRLDRVVDTVRGLFFAKYLGGVIKSGLVNLTQNVVLAAPTLSVHTKGSHVKLAKAMIDTRKALTSKSGFLGKEVKYPHLSQGEQDVIHELVSSGAATDLLLKELMGDIPGRGWGKHYKLVLNKAGIFMSMAERFNRTSTGLAAYRVAVNEKKMSHKDAINFAKGIIYDSHFLYGKTNLPELMRGGDIQRSIRTAYTFRSFTHNYVSAMGHLVANQGTEGKKAFARSLRNLLIVGGLSSIPFFKALSEALLWALGDDDKDLFTEARALMPRHWMKDMIIYGLPGVAGYDLTGSLSIEVPRNWKDIIGVPHSMIEDTVNMTRSFKAGQKWRAASETPITPLVVRNAMRGMELYTKGQITRSGREINYPGEIGPRKITATEAIGKGIVGLQPTSVSKGYASYRAIQKAGGAIAERKRQFANRYVNALRRNDQVEMDKIHKEIEEWNAKALSDNKPERYMDLRPAIAHRLRPGLKNIPRPLRQKALDISKEWQKPGLTEAQK